MSLKIINGAWELLWNEAVCVPCLAEDKAPGYNMKGYTFDGMDFFNCYGGFAQIFREVIETESVLY